MCGKRDSRGSENDMGIIAGMAAGNNPPRTRVLPGEKTFDPVEKTTQESGLPKDAGAAIETIHAVRGNAFLAGRARNRSGAEDFVFRPFLLQGFGRLFVPELPILRLIIFKHVRHP